MNNLIPSYHSLFPSSFNIFYLILFINSFTKKFLYLFIELFIFLLSFSSFPDWICSYSFSFISENPLVFLFVCFFICLVLFCWFGFCCCSYPLSFTNSLLAHRGGEGGALVVIFLLTCSF